MTPTNPEKPQRPSPPRARIRAFIERLRLNHLFGRNEVQSYALHLLREMRLDRIPADLESGVGRALIEFGKTENASEMLRTLIRLQVPDSADPTDERMRGEAARQLFKMLRKNAGDSKLLLESSHALYLHCSALQLPKSALSCMLRAAFLERTLRNLFLCAHAHASCCHFDRALEMTERLVVHFKDAKLQPNDSQEFTLRSRILELRSWLLDQQERCEESVEAYEWAIHFNDGNPPSDWRPSKWKIAHTESKRHAL